MINDVIVLGLTVYAITYILRYTDGPGDIIKLWRELCGIAYVPELDDDGNQVHIIEEIPDRFIPKLIGCWWCLSTWISIMLVVIFDLTGDVTGANLVFYWLAPVGLAGFLFEVLHDRTTSKAHL